jgi:hypothetical protein
VFAVSFNPTPADIDALVAFPASIDDSAPTLSDDVPGIETVIRRTVIAVYLCEPESDDEALENGRIDAPKEGQEHRSAGSDRAWSPVVVAGRP